MGLFDREKFYDLMQESDIVKFSLEGFTLKSGTKSHLYINWRLAFRRAYIVEQITEQIVNYVADSGLQPDCIMGVPEGATLWGAFAQMKWVSTLEDFKEGDYSIAMGRGRTKTYGDSRNRDFIGTPKGRVLLLEDVTTTGGSTLDYIDNNLNYLDDVRVVGVVCLTDRSSEMNLSGRSVREIMEERNLFFKPLSDSHGILHRIYENSPDPNLLKIINKILGETR